MKGTQGSKDGWVSDSEEHLLENIQAQYGSVSEERICTSNPAGEKVAAARAEQGIDNTAFKLF